MKLDVSKVDLENSLSIARITVGSGNDITSHYLFRLREGDVEVLSQNLRVFSGSKVTGTVEGDDGDAFTVEAWRLDKWLSGVGDGVLTLSYNGGGDVHAKCGRSKVRFRSLDPSKFPYWDKLLTHSEEVGETETDTIMSAVGLTKNFVSADDTSKPELCQIEAIGGVFWATDRRALCRAEVPVLPELSLRIPGKDIPSLEKFLSNKDFPKITLKYAERSPEDGGGACAIFVREDSSYLGVSKPTSQFPTLKVDPESDSDCNISLDMGELNAAINILSSSAPKGHESVTFRFDSSSERVVLSMPSDAGGNDEYPLSLAELEGEAFEDQFTVDYGYINGIADNFGLKKLSLGVNKRGRGGFVSFNHSESTEESEEGNKYYSVIVWRT